ncbi:hypothetical protein M3181_19575 [Mesobacillus maritimus]|uniref:hypothetical protein n=1 Tax=Mesobacillus maritimus TaxID=1643336 RepID=UPI00203EAD89|nr:hypothetical protein [Mesobacillus maritimus]MCM3671163.1 hypothetical protein [Mesobacillus maritimus]
MILINTYQELIEKLKQFGVAEDHLPSIDQPKVVLEKEVKVFNSDFNILQLSLLYSMVTVEEWQDEKSFYIIWKNTDLKSNLKRFVLYYNQQKGILRRKYVYRNNTEPRKEEKRSVSKEQLIADASRGMLAILTEGFKQMD